MLALELAQRDVRSAAECHGHERPATVNTHYNLPEEERRVTAPVCATHNQSRSQLNAFLAVRALSHGWGVAPRPVLAAAHHTDTKQRSNSDRARQGRAG
jgi:hypothetical protein